jgi:hypothetical protein
VKDTFGVNLRLLLDVVPRNQTNIAVQFEFLAEIGELCIASYRGLEELRRGQIPFHRKASPQPRFAEM